jgi:hypothetical protein
MKQLLIAIFLCVSIAGPMSLGMAAFELRFWELKENFSERYVQSQNQERIQTLVFSKSEISQVLKWEHDREFEYQGQMYDVLEIHDKGEQVEYLVWHDEEESELKEKEREYEDFDPKDQERAQSKSSFHLTFFFQEILLTSFLKPSPERLESVQIETFWKNLNTLPITPPPILF